MWVAERQDRHADMLKYAVRSMELARAAGDRPAEVMALNDIGYSHAMLGSYERAIAYCERALAASQEVGERNFEAAAWHSLGYAHYRIGSFTRAVACYEQSLDLCRELADRYNEADTLDGIGDVHLSAGDIEAASRAWTQALRIFDEIDHPDGESVRSKLRPRGRLHAVGRDRPAERAAANGAEFALKQAQVG